VHAATPAPARRSGVAAAARCGAAAGGAVAGALVAFPVGGLLATWLFARIAPRIVNSIITDGLKGVHGLEAVFAAIMLVIAGVMVTLVVVVALVAPVFVVLPMLATGMALRLSGAGLVLRTLWLTLGTVAVLSVSALLGLSALKLDAHWWMWLVIVGVAASLARVVVELVWPEHSARVPGPVSVGRRMKLVGVVWLIVVVAVLAALAIVFVGFRVHIH
jgi:hypothetical protein